MCLEALFDHDKESFEEAVVIWKTRGQDSAPSNPSSSANAPTNPNADNQARHNHSASRIIQDVNKRFPHA
jgi:hypothetical protein